MTDPEDCVRHPGTPALYWSYTAGGVEADAFISLDSAVPVCGHCAEISLADDAMNAEDDDGSGDLP